MRDRLVQTLHDIAPLDPERHIPRVVDAEPLPKHQIDESEVQRWALYSPNPEFIRYAVRYLGRSVVDRQPQIAGDDPRRRVEALELPCA